MAKEKSCGQRLAEAMQEKFPDKVKVIRVELTEEDKKRNNERSKAVLKFLRMVEDAHKRAGKSKLRFGYAA